MKITILQVGKTKERAFVSIEDEFMKRVRPYAKCEVITIKISDKEEENRALQSRLPEEGTLVMLDAKGKSMTSEMFADWIRRQRDFEGGKITFLIGGPHGLTNETLARADLTLSLSAMTFTHQMARLFLLEQLYRGFMILAGKSYHY